MGESVRGHRQIDYPGRSAAPDRPTGALIAPEGVTASESR